MKMDRRYLSCRIGEYISCFICRRSALVVLPGRIIAHEKNVDVSRLLREKIGALHSQYSESHVHLT